MSRPEGKSNEALIRLTYWKEEEPLTQAVRTQKAGGDSSFKSKLKDAVFGTEPSTPQSWLGGEMPQDPSQVYTLESTLPRHKIDFFLADLTASGFYEQQHRPVGPALMSLKVDQSKFEKRWDLEPRLLDFINQALAADKTYNSEKVRFVPQPHKSNLLCSETLSEQAEPEPEEFKEEMIRLMSSESEAESASPEETLSEDEFHMAEETLTEKEGLTEEEAPEISEDENNLDFSPDTIFQF
ncbi:MAG: hypothetical protein R3C11_07925 [Planctomycetaceae bacterium]